MWIRDSLSTWCCRTYPLNRNGPFCWTNGWYGYDNSHNHYASGLSLIHISWAKCGENDGVKLMTPQEVLKTAMRYKAYWKQTGGITVSGGAVSYTHLHHTNLRIFYADFNHELLQKFILILCV